MLCCFRILYKLCVIVEFNFGRVLFYDFFKVYFYNIIFEEKFYEERMLNMFWISYKYII